MSDFHDDELRARFQQLRDDDAAKAPSFKTLWDRAEVEATDAPRTHARTPLWIAAAAVVVLSVGALLRRPDDGGRVQPGDRTGGAIPAISRWTSPTASLLRPPLSDLLAPPSVLSSTLDGVIQATVKRKGVLR